MLPQCWLQCACWEDITHEEPYHTCGIRREAEPVWTCWCIWHPGMEQVYMLFLQFSLSFLCCISVMALLGTSWEQHQVWLLFHLKEKESSFDQGLAVHGWNRKPRRWVKIWAGCHCYQEKEWGHQPMLQEEVTFCSPSVDTISHTPTAHPLWTPALQTLGQ